MENLQTSDKTSPENKKFIKDFRQNCYDAMNDDLSTPAVLSLLFEGCHIINSVLNHKSQIDKGDLEELKQVIRLFAFDILGLENEYSSNNVEREKAYGKVVDMVLDLRAKAKANKEWAVSDQIRNALTEAGFQIKDTKDGVSWKLDK